MVNKQSYMMKVRAKIKSIMSKNKNFDGNNLIKMIIFERFVERVNSSIYNEMVVFKGGFILAHKFNVWDRSSGDLDYTFKLSKREHNYKQEVFDAVKEICKIDLDDGVTLNPLGYEDILKNQEDVTNKFDGIRITFDSKLYDFSYKISMDIQIIDIDTSNTEDVVVYKSIDVLGNEITIREHGLTSIMSDKVSAILNHSVGGTRMRDYYDLWLIENNIDWKDKIDLKLLNKLLLNKIENIGGIKENIENIFNDEGMKEKWSSYSNKTISNLLSINLQDIKPILIEILKHVNIIK